MFRRIALAITLITGSLQADDLARVERPDPEELEHESELAIAPDGTISSWGLVRLVLPDLADGIAGPEWVETPVRAGPRGELTLPSLGGRAVTGADGEALGVVRGCLVSPFAGRVLALDVEVGPQLGEEPRRVALPWAQLAVGGGTIRYVGDAEWLRSGPEIGRR